jgi:hypothetical protein
MPESAPFGIPGFGGQPDVWSGPPAPAGQPDAVTAAIASALTPAPNTDYGSVLPYAQDRTTGALRWAMPSSARSFLQGAFDLSQGPATGTVTPAATMALTALAAPDLAGAGDAAALRTFGGWHAKTADIPKLQHAAQLERGGATPGDIWDATGWFRAPDGNWKFELNDEPFRFTTLNQPLPPGQFATTKFGLAAEHPDLLAAYPQLGQAHININDPALGPAEASIALPGPGVPPTMLLRDYPPSRVDTVHELQHAIQAQEGWGRGASMSAVFSDPQLKTALADELNSLAMRGHSIDMSTQEGAQNATEAMYKVYNNVFGEAEARLAEARADYSPSFRRAIPPFRGYDVPTNEMIFRAPRWQVRAPLIPGVTTP